MYASQTQGYGVELASPFFGSSHTISEEGACVSAATDVCVCVFNIVAASVCFLTVGKIRTRRGDEKRSEESICEEKRGDVRLESQSQNKQTKALSLPFSLAHTNTVVKSMLHRLCTFDLFNICRSNSAPLSCDRTSTPWFIGCLSV